MQLRQTGSGSQLFLASQTFSSRKAISSQAPSLSQLDSPQVQVELARTWHSFNLSPSPAKAPDIQGFIFDLDGVLTNTVEFHYRAWQQLADEGKLPFDRQANEALRA
jgi:Haloacid dehalogenase-like hydrolase